MKNAIILHGTGDSPEGFWFPWLKKELEKDDYEVWVPQLPDADNPEIDKWLPFILRNGKFTDKTIVIGHSAGASIILALLEDLNVKIKQAILVSGYSFSTGKDGINGILRKVYDWEKIKESTQEKIVFINSDNDPWGCNDFQGRRMMDMANGIQIIIKGEGHMGSNSFNQPYKEFPLLKKLII
jgi:predicted alpha/beta hydrolase family esterase